jgi:hypothetical protein
MEVCHTCDNPICVNPLHLFAGTRLVNVQDCIAKGRFQKGPKPGEKNPAARLTENQVLMVLREHKRRYGENKRLAEMLGVHHSTINCIIKRKTWKHLP